MVKVFGNPKSSASLRRMRTQAEWKVDAQMFLASEPSIRSSLALSSSAALFVKVMASICHGAAGLYDARNLPRSLPESISSISASQAPTGISVVSDAEP